MEDSELSWETLLKAMKTFDQKTLERWKSEMDNLLIFTGLLSAVVTAFAVESYQWLQEDSADASAKLLSQVSQQLASFNFAEGFKNLTIQYPSENFSPDPNDVNINMLWILSLTFSLMSTFFAIAVQQWLRRIPLPEGISVRKSARLRQLRYDGLMQWQLPMIISLLPLLVQVAVVLFLAGLLLLLRSLNHSIALVFAVVTGASLSLFTISAFLPIINARCPYKSPFVPTVLSILQMVISPLVPPVLFAACIVALVVLFLSSPLLLIFYYRGHDLSITAWINLLTSTFRGPKAEKRQRKLRTWMNKMAELFFPDRFWLSLELHELSNSVTFSASLDQSAVNWAPFGMERLDFGDILGCLEGLKTNQRSECVLRWAGHYLGNVVSNDLHLHSRFSLVNPILLERVDRTFVKLYRSLLFETAKLLLQEKFIQDPALTGILILLVETLRVTQDGGAGTSEFLAGLGKLLIDSCQLLLPNSSPSPHTQSSQTQRRKRIPPALLYQCCTKNNLKFDNWDTADRAVSWAAYEVEAMKGISQPSFTELDVIFCSTAVALITIKQHWSERPSGSNWTSSCKALLEGLHDFVTANEEHIQSKLKECESQNLGSVRLAFHLAMKTICHDMDYFFKDHNDTAIQNLYNKSLITALEKLQVTVKTFNTWGHPRVETLWQNCSSLARPLGRILRDAAIRRVRRPEPDPETLPLVQSREE
ncbi:hypothetical protein PHLCEN_2v7057 [Hermanssonia centrifuga]|uniref:DUF6535 domain-containing protein n=1 Tax=Hermanssonia centrifuga TaxID=98765 RepID=A0A2R6NXR1_9APHY|nr:hypothetical protein PHLCEN_2v7057 [Hermanssonia centrifuga]